MTWLKRLIMDGFKSYGSGRVDLPLSHGFNAIIGPNGSGKSNIVDAILFVLGGLSTKTMRASALTDLIFAGTPEESPSHRTRVEIVLNNSDHYIPIPTEEIRVSREVRKSGSSVYRLNGSVSTRKEIIDLLTLGNIGFQSRNIVLQGEIINLITMSPIERRELVESVAGITDFEEKRIEAEKELIKAQDRYREIDLILGNLRETRDRLATEKEETEKYLHLQLEIERKTALLHAVREFQLESKLERLQQKQLTRQNDITELHHKKDQIENERADITTQLKSLDQNYSRLQEHELGELQSLSDKKRANKVEFESQAKFEEKQVTRYQKEYQKQVTKVNEFITSREKLVFQETALLDELSELSQRLNEKNADFVSKRTKLDELNQSLEQHRQQVRELSKEIDGKKKQKIEYDTRKSILQSIIKSNAELLIENKANWENLQSILEKLEFELEELADKRNTASENLGNLKAQLETIQEKKTAVELQLKTVNGTISKIEAKILQLETELRVLREEKTEEALTASSDSIILATHRGDLGPITVRGPISNLFQFPSDLRTLLGTTFPTIMGAIVVPDVKTATTIIEFAKRNQFGQIVIIIEELLINRPKKESIPHSLATQMDCSDADRELGEHLFGGLRVINRLWDFDFKSSVYITPQGEIFDTNRAHMIGADTGLARISEIHEEKLPQLQDKLSIQTKQKLTLEQTITTHSTEFNTVQTNFKTEETHIRDLTQKNRELQDEIKRTRKQTTDLKQQIKTLEHQERENQRELQTIETAIVELAQINLLEGKLAKLNAMLEDQTRTELEQQINKLRDELDVFRSEETELRVELEKIQTRKNELIEPGIQNGVLRQEELLRQIDSTQQLVSELQKNHLLTEQELDNLTNKIEVLRAQLLQISEQRDTLRQTHSKITRKLTAVYREIDQIQQIINHLELEKTQYTVELENVRQNAARTKSPEQFDIETVSSLDLATLRNEVQQHQNALLALGSVNLKAPEQFAGVDKRYQDILEKREILNRERKVILETIEELERKKRTAFFSAFEKLNTHFNEIFKRLNPGTESYARLVLENPQEPFDKGIMIEARPQGKRIKSIASMSGGEKSLAALSLLFAIQKVDASPFYVFDEIDAFLDTANVNRVAELLSDMSKETQILLVTLREPMMAIADQLYAVSNIGGISLVFGIDLQDIIEGKIKFEQREAETNTVMEEQIS